MAPSAVNAQPWRFEVVNDEVRLFATKSRRGKFYDQNQDYARHDAGICMANMMKAAEGFGYSIIWDRLSGHEKAFDSKPYSGLEPMAKFSTKGLRKTNDKS